MTLSRSRPTILFVDDDADIVDILARTFERKYNVRTANSAAQALKILREAEIDLLVTDQRMPETTGIELVAQAREAGIDVTAILLTGYTEPQDIIDAINRGQVYRYVTKPWNVTEFMVTVKNALDHHHLRKEREQLLAELTKRVEALDVLYEVSQSDAALRGYEPLISRVVQSFSRILPYDLAAVLVGLDPKRPASLELYCRNPASEAALLAAKERALALWAEQGGTPFDEQHLVVHVTGQNTPSGTELPAGPLGHVAAPLSIDGRPVGVIVLFSARPDAFREDDARLLGILANQSAGVVRHLTAVLADERLRVERMVECMADGVILTDARNEVLVVNPAARAMLRIDSPEQATASHLQRLLGVHAFDLARGWEYGGAQVLREEIKLFDRILHCTVNPVTDRQGALAGVAMVLRDITDEKQLEARKEELVSIISHELRTPLTAVGGALDLVLNNIAGDVNEKQRRFLELAKDSADKLNAMVDDLLDLSKFARGKMRMSFEMTDLGELVRDAAERYAASASERRLSIEVKVPPEPVKVVGDPDRLMQVLNNLLSNAIKFSPEGQRVELELGRPEGVEGLAVLTCFNDGEPIAEADLERIFEKFEQGRSVRTRAVRGTGLGLAICRSIVEAHGGRVWAESGLARGVRFVVVVPDQPPETASSEEKPATRPGRGGTVLVVDHRPNVAFALKGLLLARGHKVFVAHSAEEAVSLARRHHPDVVSCELRLPDVDGLALFELLRHDPDTRAARVVLLGGAEQRAAAARAGASAYLEEPIEATRFIATVDGLVTQRPETLAAKVLVVDDEPGIRAVCAEVLSNIGYRVLQADCLAAARQAVREHGPEMMLLDLTLPDGDGFSLLEELKDDRVARHLSVILVTARGETASKVRALRLGAVDYLVKPFDALELAARVETALKRRQAELGASPTTRLPGLAAIEREIARRMGQGQPYVLCQLELDNLKAYNDRYGYARADAVVQQTGDLLREVLDASEGDFIGHVAGDDFVFITAPGRVDAICERLIGSFDRLIPLYYDAEDRRRGWTEVSGGRRVPLMSMSIAAVVDEGSFADPQAIARAAAELKQKVKQLPGSGYIRSDRPEPVMLSRRENGEPKPAAGET